MSCPEEQYERKIKVAVLVENDPYDVVAFQDMLDSLEDCRCIVQPIDLFVQDEKTGTAIGWCSGTI